MENNQTFLLTLKDSLLSMKGLLEKKIVQHEDFLNNKDGKLENILKTAQVNIMLNELKKDHGLTEEAIQEKLSEINKITEVLKGK